jgi:DNA modification methylase
MIKIINDDCLNALKELEDNSIDSIVTDPPYGISFMGKKWDYSVPSVDIWKECYRVLKPGGHLLSFSGSRTYHRMAVNVEDAGFEIRDQIMWVYGSGFPKSHNLKDEMKGWGTALKPAHEPIVLARKPLEKKTVVDNVLEHGTGAINIDGCRIGDGTGESKLVNYPNIKGNNYNGEYKDTVEYEIIDKGRWPANFIHDGLEEEWSKYFYCPKASKKDRNEGCEELEEKQTIGGGGTNDPNNDDVCGKYGSVKAKATNHHPTVKPTDLMRYLCRLVTPKNGVVLDPFMGSGSTGKAAVLEDFSFTGIEISEEYFNIAKTRIESLNERIKNEEEN